MATNTIPVRQMLVLLEGAKRGGASTEALLQECGIDPAMVARPDAGVDKKKFIALMQAVMRQTEDEFNQGKTVLP